MNDQCEIVVHIINNGQKIFITHSRIIIYNPNIHHSQERNSKQKNNNRQNKSQEIEKINGNRELSPSLLFLCFL